MDACQGWIKQVVSFIRALRSTHDLTALFLNSQRHPHQNTPPITRSGFVNILALSNYKPPPRVHFADWHRDGRPQGHLPKYEFATVPLHILFWCLWIWRYPSTDKKYDKCRWVLGIREEARTCPRGDLDTLHTSLYIKVTRGRGSLWNSFTHPMYTSLRCTSIPTVCRPSHSSNHPTKWVSAPFAGHCFSTVISTEMLPSSTSPNGVKTMARQVTHLELMCATHDPKAQIDSWQRGDHHASPPKRPSNAYHLFDVETILQQFYCMVAGQTLLIPADVPLLPEFGYLGSYTMLPHIDFDDRHLQPMADKYIPFNAPTFLKWLDPSPPGNALNTPLQLPQTLTRGPNALSTSGPPGGRHWASSVRRHSMAFGPPSNKLTAA